MVSDAHPASFGVVRKSQVTAALSDYPRSRAVLQEIGMSGAEVLLKRVAVAPPAGGVR